jgi:uncharacterized membrane protein
LKLEILTDKFYRGFSMKKGSSEFKSIFMTRFLQNCLVYTSIFVLFLVSLPMLLYAKSYRMDSISIRAEVLPDGNMYIDETRTYTFRGKFNWADYKLPLNGIGNVLDFSLNDQHTSYRESESQQPGTYEIEKNEYTFHVRWYYRANNQTRTFTLHYLITNVVTVYDDVAELYYKFVGEENEMPVGQVSVVIKLPGQISTSDVKAWAHGPLWGGIRFEQNELLMDVAPLPARTYWEARVLFPREWVPFAERKKSGDVLPTVLAQEAAWAKKANEEREKARQQLLEKKEKEKTAWPFSIALALINIFGLFFLYQKYGRGAQVPYYQKIDSELPQDEPPAIISALYMNKQVRGAALSATLFDLARRGYLKLEQVQPTSKKWWSSKKPEFLLEKVTDKVEAGAGKLEDYESDMLRFIFDELGEGQNVVPLKIFRKKRMKVRHWFVEWSKMLKEHLNDIPLYEKSSIRGTVYGVLLCIAAIAGGVLILVYLGTPGILPVVTGGLLLGAAFAILKYTPEMKLKRKKWQALRRYLAKYHFLEGQGSGWLSNIEKYLIYGLALGVGQKAIKKMMESIPEQQQASIFPWYIYAHGAYASPADFATAISSVVQIASSTMSSSSGAGGGASGGGGGGGGGASGGAG